MRYDDASGDPAKIFTGLCLHPCRHTVGALTLHASSLARPCSWSHTGKCVCDRLHVELGLCRGVNLGGTSARPRSACVAMPARGSGRGAVRRRQPTYSTFGAKFRAGVGLATGIVSLVYPLVTSPFVFAFTERDPRLSYPVVRPACVAVLATALRRPCIVTVRGAHAGALSMTLAPLWCVWQVSAYVPTWLLAVVVVPVPIAMFVLAYVVIPWLTKQALKRYARTAHRTQHYERVCQQPCLRAQ